MIEYHSIQNILDLCKEQDKKIWEVVLQADMDESGASGAGRHGRGSRRCPVQNADRTKRSC